MGFQKKVSRLVCVGEIRVHVHLNREEMLTSVSVQRTINTHANFHNHTESNDCAYAQQQTTAARERKHEKGGN